MVSKLALQDIPTSDSRFLRLVDNSYYNPDITVECAIIEITPPGKDCPVAFYVDKGFNTVFNSSLLQVSIANSHDNLMPLPEGVYKIKYSINPNTILNVEYSYLRNTQQLGRYYREICSLFSRKNDMTRANFAQKKKELSWIKEIIDSAKYCIEECDKLEEGITLYNEANDLLYNYNPKNNTCR